ncbi:GFA family protein [Devosia rhodophyticola]|uniref:GFA family protein n=1 Tax=Devosia rhodophyticola TaxID=3026423 RepID=A0ABY7YVU4_9HYPH|nr:GFA family protein [Devosia rhodophyticola]WDR05064.1 GFA family protein [Devosia rhodophyticola]
MPLTATCHCGAIRIEVDRAPENATACTCTYCSKSGALWAYYRPDEVRIITADNDKIYAPRGMNLHHFCANCGTNTYGDTPDWSETDIGNDTPSVPTARKIGLNVKLFDDFDLTGLPIVEIDGRNLW